MSQEPWRCEKCGGRAFARVDELKSDGSFGPGPEVRCIECKNVSHSTNPTEERRERIAAILEGYLDLPYSIRLIRLVDGVSTYTLDIDGEPTLEFPSHSAASEYLTWRRSERCVDAILSDDQSHVLREALEGLLQLPVAKANLDQLDHGIGTKTENAAWLVAREALARGENHG